MLQQWPGFVPCPLGHILLFLPNWANSPTPPPSPVLISSTSTKCCPSCTNRGGLVCKGTSFPCGRPWVWTVDKLKRWLTKLILVITYHGIRHVHDEAMNEVLSISIVWFSSILGHGVEGLGFPIQVALCSSDDYALWPDGTQPNPLLCRRCDKNGKYHA